MAASDEVEATKATGLCIDHGKDNSINDDDDSSTTTIPTITPAASRSSSPQPTASSSKIPWNRPAGVLEAPLNRLAARKQQRTSLTGIKVSIDDIELASPSQEEKGVKKVKEDEKAIDMTEPGVNLRPGVNLEEQSNTDVDTTDVEKARNLAASRHRMKELQHGENMARLRRQGDAEGVKKEEEAWKGIVEDYQKEDAVGFLCSFGGFSYYKVGEANQIILFPRD